MANQHEKILVLDFGGQYNQLIARRVREEHVYAEVLSYTTPLEEIKAKGYKGIIFTGGPQSVFKEDSPSYDPAIFELGIPILGICYGAQFMAHALGGTVKTAPVSEYGHTEVVVDSHAGLLEKVATDNVTEEESGCAEKGHSIFWMSHTDYISEAPEGFTVTAHTDNCPIAAMENPDKQLYAVQFHPEVVHSKEGKKIFKKFVMEICGCAGDWQMDTFVTDTLKEIREKVGDG